MEVHCPQNHTGSKEGRKDYICSSRLGLIRWYDRFRSNRRIQQVIAILDKVRYTNDILLPHELLHGASANQNSAAYLSRTPCKAGHSKTMWRSSPTARWSHSRHKRRARGAPVRRP